ncbi:MAG TPA: YMGG-like glycine zipper-containing protein, partial [Flavisolibacter sp.]|nr:YMGG-like glycine zipper-containing protein [Flavisolibacter sp.]
MNKFWYLVCLVLFITIGLNSYGQHRKWSPKAKNAVIGAGAGAVIGALVDKKNRGAGALIGGALGGGVGYLYGRHRVHEMAEDRRANAATAYYRRSGSWAGRGNGY